LGKKNFEVIKANLMNANELSKHLENKDCIVSALGAPGVHFFKIKFYLESMQSLVEAMRKANLKRIICITAFYTKRIYLLLFFNLNGIIKTLILTYKADPNYPNVYKYVLRPMIGRQLDSM